MSGRANISNDFFGEGFLPPKNKKDYILFLLKTDISSTKYDGKDCYCIDITKGLGYTDILFNPGIFGENARGDQCKIYFEKDTGLIRENTYNYKKYNYKFGSLTEKDFIKPDFSEYRLVDDFSAVYMKMCQQLKFDFRSEQLITMEFNLKFANLSGEQDGKNIKELLKIILDNIVENKKYDLYLPDIMYLEKNQNTKLNMSNIEDLNDNDIEILIDEEEFGQLYSNLFKFNYNRENSFKIVSNVDDINVNEIVNLGKQIDENEKYLVKFVKDSLGIINTIIINKQ